MKHFIIGMVTLCVSTGLRSQSVDCVTAVHQLQSYADQINQIYQYEYWQGIPNSRCPAFDVYGRPFHPQLVQDCRLQMLGSLNQWYAQQSNYVNTVYMQIARGCSTQSPRNKPAPDPIPGPDQGEEIDTEMIEDLSLGVDEDQAVKIVIPSTAAGFKPR